MSMAILAWETCKNITAFETYPTYLSDSPYGDTDVRAAWEGLICTGASSEDPLYVDLETDEGRYTKMVSRDVFVGHMGSMIRRPGYSWTPAEHEAAIERYRQSCRDCGIRI